MGHLDVARVLLEAKADVNTLNEVRPRAGVAERVCRGAKRLCTGLGTNISLASAR